MRLLCKYRSVIQWVSRCVAIKLKQLIFERIRMRSIGRLDDLNDS